jgi:hypothetical protein
MSRWFRFYSGVVDDPKAQMLSPEMFKHWVNVLCIAAQNDGELPAISATAFTLRISEPKAAGILARLHGAGLLDKTVESFKPHNWDARQYKTDDKLPKGKESYVYFIGISWEGMIKIGFSKNPWARVVDIQTSHHEKMEVLAAFRCKSYSEVALHEILKEYRKQGEWFSLPAKIYVAARDASERKLSYEGLVAEITTLLRSATTETEQSRTEQNRADAGRKVSISEKVLKTDLMEAFGPSRSPDLSRTSVWLSKGYSATLILDVVRDGLARKPDIATLNYFDAALADKHATRPESPSERAAAQVDMDKVAEMFKKTGVWSRYAGPEPGMTGCKCPPEILTKHGIEVPGLRRMSA